MSLNNWHRVHVLLNTLTFRVGYGVDRRRLHYIYLIPQVFLNIKQIISGLRVQLMEVCFDSAYKLKPRLKQRMHMGYISQFIIRLIFEEWKPTPSSILLTLVLPRCRGEEQFVQPAHTCRGVFAAIYITNILLIQECSST